MEKSILDEIISQINIEALRINNHVISQNKSTRKENIILPIIRRIPDKQGYVINDFLRFTGEEFVKNSYLGLLKREPSSEELSTYYYMLLNQIYTKEDILWQIINSNEGKENGVWIAKIRMKYYLKMFKQIVFYKIPLFSYVLRMVLYIILLPKIVKMQKINEMSVYNDLSKIYEYLNVLEQEVD